MTDNPSYFTKVLSACELRTEFTRRPCCNKSCCVKLLNMPLDHSVPSNWSSLFCGEISPMNTSISENINGLSDASRDFENFIVTLRAATSKYRLNTVESEAMMSQYLRNKFIEKHRVTDNGHTEWIYDLIHPVNGSIVVCRRAWIACFGVTWQKVRFAQECVKAKNLIPTRTINDSNVESLKDAFDRFGLALDDYHRSFDNFMDISKVSQTEGSLLATAWLSREFDAIGEAQPDEDVILIDHVEEKDVYERYKHDTDLKSFTSKVISYQEFTRIWREVFPKVEKLYFKNYTTMASNFFLYFYLQLC